MKYQVTVIIDESSVGESVLFYLVIIALISRRHFAFASIIWRDHSASILHLGEIYILTEYRQCRFENIEWNIERVFYNLSVYKR